LGVIAVKKVDNLGRDFLVHRLRALQRQRTFVLARLVLRLAVGRLAPEHWARWRQTGRRLGIHGAGYLRHTGDRRVLARRSDALRGRVFVDVRDANSSAIHLLMLKARTTDKAKAGLSTMLWKKSFGLIRKPDAMKKIGMKMEFPRNSSSSFAGLSSTAALTARPARNAPTMSG